MPVKLEIERHELEDFVKSRVWRYMVATLIEKVGEADNMLRTADPLKDASNISQAQGAIRAYGEVADLPAVMAEELEYEKKKQQPEEERENAGRN